MAKTVLKKTYLTQQDFNAAKENVTLAKSGVIVADDNGLYLSAATVSSKVTVHGQIVAEDIGIVSLGDGTRVTVSGSGLIFGDFAVALSGNNSRGVNNGTLVGDNVVVYLGGDNTRFVNNGVIRGDDGANLYGDGSVFTNGKSGIIEVWSRGVMTTADSGDTTRTINLGRMENSKAYVLFEGGASNDTFINKGIAKGWVALGAGDDVFDGRGGRHEGKILGGAGHDVLYADRASLQLTENPGEGSDSVFASVTYTLADNVENLFLIGKKSIDGTGNDGANWIMGNAADNTLSGLAGADILDGRKGKDTLTGGGDADIFVFGTGYGVDTVTDFTVGVDEIDLQRWKAVTDFDDLMDNHAFDKGGNVELRDGKDKLVLLGVSKEDLAEADFNFG